MTSVPLESNASSPQINHFSSLPNELLHDIFEYAYKDSPPSHPLSKHLVPFFEENLYRKVSLSSLSTFEQFLASILATPTKGPLVQTLGLPSVSNADDVATFAIDIRRMLSLLPNLVNLNVPGLPAPRDSNHQAITSSPALPRLESLEVSLKDRKEDGIVDLDGLAQFGALPLLKRLRVYDWAEREPQYVHCSNTTLLPSVTRLEVQGEGADVEIVKFLLDACPSLLHLELDATYEGGAEFSTRLSELPATLHSLHLHGTHPAQGHVDSILFRLTQLRSLHLGNGCYSGNLPTALQQLPHLVDLRLDHGKLDPNQLQALLADPSPLCYLRNITLNFEKGQIGGHMPKPSTVASDYNFGFEFDFVEYSNLMPEWCLPGVEGENTLNASDMGMLQSVAEDNGLGIKGNLKSTIQMITDYHIEANNRAVLMSYRRGDLASLRDVQNASTRDGVAPPPLELDYLDIDRLEIVEIDLPEQDWFMLSLRNKE
ncbi:hypothetical protein JCM5353_007709 [Sporobolomyces roseus]